MTLQALLSVLVEYHLPFIVNMDRWICLSFLLFIKTRPNYKAKLDVSESGKVSNMQKKTYTFYILSSSAATTTDFGLYYKKKSVLINYKYNQFTNEQNIWW